MIDIRDLRENPQTYRTGARHKGVSEQTVDELLQVDRELRELQTKLQELTAEKNRIGKEIGQLAGRLKKADADAKAELQARMKELQARPAAIKAEEQALADAAAPLEGKRDELLLLIPQPADADVPVGASADENV